MPWHLTNSITDFDARAGGFLYSDPVRNTVPLTVLAALRQSGLAVYGDTPPVFCWHELADGEVDGACLRTPPHPLLIVALPDPADLIELLGRPAQVNLPAEDAEDLTATWAKLTGGGTAVRRQSREFRLGDLQPPDPFPSGTARVAGQQDFDLLVEWIEAFGADIGERDGDPRRAVADKLSYQGASLWEDDGQAVSMAILTREVAGVCRVGTVYTPAQYRRRGYGGAITTAVSQRALDAGAEAVVLYTDLANPTSNALYQRLGYRPVADRVMLDLL